MTANAQIETDLIGYWEFENNLDETSGAHSGGLHNGSEDGTVAYAAGPNADFGDALDLDGNNGVFVDNSSNSDVGYVGTFDADINAANAMSVSFWAQGTPGGWNPFVSKFGELSEGWQVRRRSAGNDAIFTLQGTDGDIDPAGANSGATSGGWRHFLSVWDGVAGTRKLYIDGVEDTVATIASGDFSTTGNMGPGNANLNYLCFGMRDDGAAFGNYFNGEIDDVAIWSRALTDLEALHLANNPVSDVMGQVDTDGDGLLDGEETVLGTNINLPDTDGDGVSDYDESRKAGADPLTNDDPDMDGLSNLEETSGSENPYVGSSNVGTPGDATDWCVDDSDADGISDGDELGMANGFVTNPNSLDTDGDGWADGVELGISDPTDPQSVPPVDTNLIGYWQFEDDLVESSGAHATTGLHDGEWVTTAGGVFVAGPDIAFGKAVDVSGGNAVRVLNASNTTYAGSYVDTFDDAINSAGGMTISFWASGWPGRWESFLSKNGESVGWQVRRRHTNPHAVFTVRGTAGADDPTGTNNASSGQPVWRHYVGTWDADGNRKLYVDGVEDLATTLTGDTSGGGPTDGPGGAAAFDLLFGARHNNDTTYGQFFGGPIDDVAIWSRAITAAEALQLANNPLSVVIVNTDTDGDGLFDAEEDIIGTDKFKPDTDDDGVNDLDEVNKGSDPLNDNDFDMDGLSNLEETSGSENPFGGAITDWCSPDSDFDGILDGEEVVAGTDTFVTDPLDADTDDDGFADGAETSANPVSDPTDGGDTGNLTDWERSLCGYWPLDSDFTDSGFLGLDGTLVGDIATTAVFAAGQFGQAIDLDYSLNQRVQISGDENYLDTVGSSVTVSAWVQVEALNVQWAGIFAKGEQSWRVARRQNSAGAAFAAGTNGDAPSTSAVGDANPIDDGNWHHVVGVGEFGVATRIYVDGLLVEERTDALPNVIDVAFAAEIGRNPESGRSWNGNIDDAAVWKRALSAEEIYTMYSNGNDVQYLIDNDVAPVPIPDPVVTIDAFGFDGFGDFNLEVSGLNPETTYQMMQTETLNGGDWLEVDDPFTGGTSNTFTDTNPLLFSEKGFYQIFEVTPEP
ncbi:LamG-like jellyroll fold domain-containing protein [Haloferula sp.]|uniref:LamG domain-containing protein n=1 Tax=Haloferula sp. TaxID=2497595 RepID=UPI00329AED61